MPPKRDDPKPKRQKLTKLDHREWLLLRPDAHIGEVKPMELPHLTFCPGDDEFY